MRMKRMKSAVLMGALACIPLMAGGCKKAQAPDDEGSQVSSAKSRSGTYGARSVKRPKRGSTIMGGGSLSTGGSLSAGNSLTGGSSTRGPEAGPAPSRRGGF